MQSRTLLSWLTGARQFRRPGPSPRAAGRWVRHPLHLEEMEQRVVPVASLSVGDATFNLAAGATGYEVTRTGDLTPAVDVGYAVTDGTALSGTNYTSSAPTGVLHFESGQTSATIPLTILSNNFPEPGRAFTVDLTGVVATFGPTATFAAQQTFTTGTNPLSISAADLNGDGRPDLLVVNRGGATVSVRLNTTAPGATTPTFAAQQTFAVGSQPISLVAADVNGDGRTDLLVANYVSDTVSVLLNTTPPGATTFTFAAQSTFATGNGPSSVSVADMNGDGRSDVFVANYGSNTVSVLLNTTAPGAAIPTFAAQQTFGTGTQPNAAVAADVNGDGKPDLLVANFGSDDVSVLLNTTTPGAAVPSFAAQQAFAAETTPYSLVTADVNGDGRADIIALNRDSDTVSVLLNTTAPGAAVPTFAAQQSFATSDNPTSVSVADVNGDGRPDILIANLFNPDPNLFNASVSVLENTTLPGALTPSFATQQTHTTGNQTSSVSTADVNGDGKPDILAANYGSNSISVLLNTTSHVESTGSGTPEPVFPEAATPATGTFPVSLTAADLNGDGLTDLVVANRNSNTVSVLLNTTAPGASTPSFAAQVSFGVGTTPKSVTLADVNGDGRADIIVANQLSDNVSVLLNTTGPGATTPSFAVQGVFSVGMSPRSVAAVDVNGDGRPDLLVANATSNSVSVLLNTTPPGAAVPTFASHVDFSAGAYSRSVAAVDVNGDGRPDLLVANRNSNNVSVLLNTTSPGAIAPSFATQVTMAAGSSPYSVAAADVNGDGLSDIIVANINNATVSVLLNTTPPGALTPTFSPPQAFATGTLPTSVAAKDVNGDGRLDLIVSNTGSNSVSVLLNTTTPGSVLLSYSVQQTFATGTSPRQVAAEDINGDGRFDVLVANESSNTVSVLLNTPAILGSSTATGTIDGAAVVQSFVLAGTTPTNSVTVSFTVTFSEAVSGLTTANFVLTGTATVGASIGTPTTSNGGITWTVPVTTAGEGTLGLTLNTRTGIADSAGNQLYNTTTDDGSVFNPVVGPQYTIEKTAPTATITSGPPTSSTSRDAAFSFTGTDSGSGVVRFETSLDGAAFVTATSPQTFSGLSVGAHTFQVRSIDLAGNVSAPVSYTWTVAALPVILVGAGAGSSPVVGTYNAAGALQSAFFAFDPRFTGGVSVARGDVDGDNVADMIVGLGSAVAVYSGANGGLLNAFFAFPPGFTGRVTVASGDINGDGRADIIVGTGAGSLPAVAVYSGTNGALLNAFFAFPPGFLGGVNVASEDINGDGRDDIIVGAGSGALPVVAVYSGIDGSLLNAFFAFDPQFAGGVTVASGDINGDGRADIIVGTGAGSLPVVAVYSGTNGALLNAFFAFPPGFPGGVNVASEDINGDGRDDIIVGAGSGALPVAAVYSGADLSLMTAFLAFPPGFSGGVFVG